MKWTEMAPVERHRLLGELIDAMIYNDKAMAEVQSLVESFRSRDMIRSVILPEYENLQTKKINNATTNPHTK